MVDPEHPKLQVVRQCALLVVNRTSLYYLAEGDREEELPLMRERDRGYWTPTSTARGG